MHCAIVDAAAASIDAAAALEFVSDPAFGGFTMFVGRVRDLNHGRAVVAISYDVFDAMALAGFHEIARAAQEEVGADLKIHITHAKGRLAVGAIAVVVAVGSPHRDEAFGACRQVIEAIKHSSPIWKQEHYLDGDSQWSEGCSLCEGHLVVDKSTSRRSVE